MATYTKLLDEIRRKAQEYGDTMQPACPPDRLARLRKDVKRQLGIDLPGDYSAFLSINDGLCWNGLYVLASHRSLIAGTTDAWIDGFIERNIEERRFDDRTLNYVVFAEDGEVSFALNISEGRYDIVSRVARYVDESFTSFEDLLTKAMQNHL